MSHRLADVGADRVVFAVSNAPQTAGSTARDLPRVVKVHSLARKLHEHSQTVRCTGFSPIPLNRDSVLPFL